MTPDKAVVISLDSHPQFQDHRRLAELKNALLAETLAFAQVALDNAALTGSHGPRAVRILERARRLLEEARERLVREVL